LGGHSGQWTRGGQGGNAGHRGFEEFATGDFIGATVALERMFGFHARTIALEPALARKKRQKMRERCAFDIFRELVP
jgi:hypothetical protein